MVKQQHSLVLAALVLGGSLCSGMSACHQSRGRSVIDGDAMGDGDDTGANEGNGGDDVCQASEAGPDTAPARRLTTTEITRSLPVLFPGMDLPDLVLPRPELVEGFRNNVRSQPNNPLLIDTEYLAAGEVGRAAAAQLEAWAPCGETDLGCLEEIADELLYRAFRRPPTSDEKERLMSVVEAQFADGGFDSALEDLVVATLLSPQFLYRLEFGVTADDDDDDSAWIPLSGYEVATRLSFFLWGRVPDEDLLRAAADGELDTIEGISDVADRMVDEEVAKEAVEEFFAQWLQFESIGQIELNAEAFPELDEELSSALQESLRRFVASALWEQESLDELFDSDRVFVDARLADLLSVDGPEEDEGFESVVVPNRRGILTQPGFLASTSHGTTHSAILRGLGVLKNFLCIDVPAPPPDVNASIEPQDEANPVTTRDHLEQTHNQPECSGCHDLIDGVGFSFEHYDALGRFVTEENGAPVDSSGVVPVGGERVNVADGMELAGLLGESREVKRCITEQWYRFAFGVAVEGPGGRCEVERLAGTWEETMGDPRAMLTQIVTSNTFRFRPRSGGE